MEIKQTSPRVASAAKFLGLSEEELNKTITQMGLSESDFNDDAVFKFQDFKEVLNDHPIASVRKAYRELRGGKADTELTGSGTDRIDTLKTLGYKVKLDDAPSIDLLRVYDPTKPSDPITNVLRKRFGENPVIAFHEDGTVAVDVTANYIADVEQGYPASETATVDGALVRLWPVGVKPDNFVEEDPLHPGLPLRRGHSTVNNRNWSTVNPNSRKMCRIIVERGDINVNDRDAVLRLMEKALGGGTAVTAKLIDAYPEAWLDYREKDKRDELPKLQVKLGELVKPNNPFGVNRKY